MLCRFCWFQLIGRICVACDSGHPIQQTDSLVLRFVSHFSSHAEDCTSITLWRERGRPLGIKLGGHRSQPGIFVYEILPDSVAALDCRLHPYDRILAINGHDVRYTRLDTASRLIERSRSSVTLSVAVNNNVDGASLCSSAPSETFSEHSSNNSSPRIYLPSSFTTADPTVASTPSSVDSSTSNHSTASTSTASSSPPLTHYPASDVSATDTDDSDSSHLTGPDRIGSPHQWGTEGGSHGNSNGPSEVMEDRWPPLPAKPRLAQKTAVIKKVSRQMSKGGNLWVLMQGITMPSHAAVVSCPHWKLDLLMVLYWLSVDHSVWNTHVDIYCFILLYSS